MAAMAMTAKVMIVEVSDDFILRILLQDTQIFLGLIFLCHHLSCGSVTADSLYLSWIQITN